MSTSEAAPKSSVDAAVPSDAGSVKQRLARVYAESLLAVADRDGQADEINRQLREVVIELFPAKPELRDALGSLAVSRDEKSRVIGGAFASASPAFQNFLNLLNDHDRLDLLDAVCVELGAMLDEREGRTRVFVQSATPLTEPQRDRLREQMKQWLRREPVLVETVNPDLLAGMRVLVGDELFDMSARNQLTNIRNQLLSRSSHEIQGRRDRFRTD